MTETVWEGPRLLVPMTLEAICLTRASYASDRPWSWATPDYWNLDKLDGVNNAPFNNDKPAIGDGSGRFTGAVLHWALPSGITAGQQGTDDEIRYPALPNRWLIVRRSVRRTTAAFTHAAWILASDVASESGAPLPNADGTRQILLGRTWPLSDWPGEAAMPARAAADPLTAAGPGDPAFSAYVPNVAGMLSFPDALEDVEAGPVSYLVVGWYAQDAEDPLHGWTATAGTGARAEDRWRTLMSALGWSVGDEGSFGRAVEAGQAWAHAHGFSPDPTNALDILPARCLFHGALLDFAWPGADGGDVSGVPAVDRRDPSYVRPRVALGYDTAEAVTALLAERAAADGMDPEEVKRLERVLLALQHDALHLLDDDDAQMSLELRKRAARFGALDGGTAWDVVGPEDASEPEGRTTPPPLSEAQAEALLALRRTQADLDAAARDLAAAQGECYSLWWKSVRVKHITVSRPDREKWQGEIEAATGRVEAETRALIQRWERLDGERTAAYEKLRSGLTDGRPVETAAPPFWVGNDPVLLIAGAGRSYKHGLDGRFSDDGTLFCRFTGQTVDGIAVATPAGERVVDGRDVPVPRVEGAGLPIGVQDLVAEAFFLDLTSAPSIASVADPETPWASLDQIRRKQTLIWNPDLYAPLDRRTIEELGGLRFMYGLGALPSKLSATFWSPPWSPVYVDYEVEYLPSALDPRDALAEWSFVDGSDDPLAADTYAWAGPIPPPTTKREVLKSRVLLTPQAPTVLAATIERLISAYGDDHTLAPMTAMLMLALDDIENSDLLSQSMSGLIQNLLGRTFDTYRVPSRSLDPYLRPARAPALSPHSTPALTRSPTCPFYPLVSGHVKFRRLHVVDAFGQVYKVLDVKDALGGEPFEPILPKTMRTPGDPSLVQFAPRIAQPSRLEFRLLEEDGATGERGRPVCGWIIPNRIDRSLAFYARAGDPLGEIILAGPDAIWLPAPDESPPARGGGDPVTIPDRHARAVVEGIVAGSDPPGALLGLLALIDEISWSTSPETWSEGALPLLVGRPIAIVRASLALRIYGPPATDQSWGQTGRSRTGGFETVRFDARLGATELLDDGLIGYFEGGDYSRIRSAYASGSHPYVAGQSLTLDLSEGATDVTMLVMPGMSVHAFTAVTPPAAIEMASDLIVPDLSRMRVIFRCGPVLTEPGPTHLPLPATERGAWSWLQYEPPPLPAQARIVRAVGPEARLPDAAPLLREGWLRLDLDGARTLLTYEVTPYAVGVGDASDDRTASLTFTAYNGSGSSLVIRAIRFDVPTGNGAGALTDEPSLIQVTSSDPAWIADNDGLGHLVLRPGVGGRLLDAGATIDLSIANLRVNPEVGTVQVDVWESSDRERRRYLNIWKL